MKTVFSERHRLYRPRFDIVNGRVTETASPASNADIVHDAVRRDIGGTVLPPVDHGPEPFLWLHDSAFLEFLRTAWDQWVAAFGSDGEALPLACVQRGMRQQVPDHIEGKLSYYALDIGTPITEGTWPAVYDSAQVALTAADLVSGGEPAAYALARPGGHHAGRDYYGGYCFVSTEGLVIEHLRRRGAARVAYLDIDYHHCNGTQSIFYARPDVLTVSLHCDPRHDYPYFSGFADETGEATGLGYNHNLPLPPGTTWEGYDGAFGHALDVVRDFGPDALVVLLGVDTFEKDAISKFKLDHDAFPRIGERIAGLRRPTVFVKGGGYSEEALDRCVTAALGGFLGAS